MCEDNGCSCIGADVGETYQSAYDYANLIEAAIVFYSRNFEFDTVDDQMDAVSYSVEEIIESDLNSELIYEGTVTLGKDGFEIEVQMDEEGDNGFKIQAQYDEAGAVTINALPYVINEASDIDDLPFDPDVVDVEPSCDSKATTEEE